MERRKNGKKERKLTAAEEKRKTAFLRKKEQMEAAGFIAKDLTVTMTFANIMALVLTFPPILVLRVIFMWKNGYGTMPNQLWLAVLVLFFVLVVVHEAIHGLFWAISAKNGWKSISFGIMRDSLTPYCTCQEELSRSQYAIGAMMPCVLLGVLPAVAAILLGSLPLFWVGALMILAAGGDLTILCALLRNQAKGKEVRYLDHPYEAGLVVFERQHGKNEKSC